MTTTVNLRKEFCNLLSISHPHIVKLIGYCYELHHEHVEYNGKLRFSQRTYRAICLEYLQGGSLDRYLTACYNGYHDRDWRTLFNIIKGVCEGLSFLHEGCGAPILHLDLKPANILLDDNMIAKIADFGLSRIFHGEHISERESVNGTTKYMAPEYQFKKMISPKNDVFSLGVTMIEVMAGPTGYEDFCEMGDVEKFIHQVNMDWTEQINATASQCASIETEQVDICITIAMKCVDVERNNRPTVAEIVRMLEETEKGFVEESIINNPEKFLMDQSLSIDDIVKSGVVGGTAGIPRDMEVKPWRLESVTITHSGLIDALSFSYIDKAGKRQTVGPWGEGYHHSKIETIRFGPSEFVVEVSGAYGIHFGNTLIMSLTFVTNIRTYGPFGNPYYQNVPSSPFSFLAGEDSSVVGFHGRSGQHIYSIGVYMARCPSNMKTPRPLPMPGQIHGPEVAPQVMPLELLRKITNDFSKEQKLGRGAFGTVYKGVLDGKEVAVKLLHSISQGLDYEEEFVKEFENLRRLNHPNIVQLLGYCYEIKHEFIKHEGRSILVDKIYRALCFDYMHNGSLQRYLDDKSCRLDWQTRYKVIKGICEGLKYLHKGLENPMFHLDLKPDNILLDKNMVPKLADFGLSKLVCDNQTQATSSFLGTVRYCPPEHIERYVFSSKFDIFSLGVVMIEITAGPESYCKAFEMSSHEFIDHVQENWRRRIHATPGYTLPTYEFRQVKRCMEIALECVHRERTQRPNIEDIISRLNESENNTEKSATISASQNET